MLFSTFRGAFYVSLYIIAFLKIRVCGYSSQVDSSSIRRYSKIFVNQNRIRNSIDYVENRPTSVSFFGRILMSSEAGVFNEGSSSSSDDKERIVVAVDLDEVLGQFVESLSNFHNQIYGTNLNVSDFHSYEFHKVWGGTQDEASIKVNEFFESKYFLEEIRPEPLAYETLLSLKEIGKFDFKLVTSRQLAIQEETEKWIEIHYPGIFSSLHFGNHYGSSGKKLSKGEICESIGAKILIDDQLKYALDCSAKGLKILLYGHYPWNNTNHRLDASDLIMRVQNWTDVSNELINFELS